MLDLHMSDTFPQSALKNQRAVIITLSHHHSISNAKKKFTSKQKRRQEGDQVEALSLSKLSQVVYDLIDFDILFSTFFLV